MCLLEITLNKLFNSVIIIKRPKPASYGLQVQSSDGVSSECYRKGMSSLFILDNRIYLSHVPQRGEFSHFFVYHIYVFLCIHSG